MSSRQLAILTEIFWILCGLSLLGGVLAVLWDIYIDGARFLKRWNRHPTDG
jgi:hypothetical protein